MDKEMMAQCMGKLDELKMMMTQMMQEEGGEGGEGVDPRMAAMQQLVGKGE